MMISTHEELVNRLFSRTFTLEAIGQLSVTAYDLILEFHVNFYEPFD